MPRIRRVARPAAAVAGAGLLLAACGGSTGTKVASTKPASTAAATTTTAVTLPASGTVATPAPAVVMPEPDTPVGSAGPATTVGTTTRPPATKPAPGTTAAAAPGRTELVDATALVRSAIGSGTQNVTVAVYAQKAATALQKALAARKGAEGVAVKVGWTGTGDPAGVVLVATGTGLPGVTAREYHLKVDKAAGGLALTSAAVADVCQGGRAKPTACR